MKRNDYEIIHEKHNLYFKSWETKDVSFIPEVFSLHVGYFTSTSLYMPDGSQNSQYGVRDFILDFPKTDHTHVQVCNYTCRGDETTACTYAEAVCDCNNDNGHYFQFTALVQCHWKKEDEWRIVWLRQDIVPVKGNMTEPFKKVWYLKEKLGRNTNIQQNRNFAHWNIETNEMRGDLLFAQEDSPWLLYQNDKFYSDEEAVTDVIYSYYYGLEHMLFSQSYNCLSLFYGSSTGNCDGEGRRNKMISEKEIRLKQIMPVNPIKIDHIDFEQGRAFIYADGMADLQFAADTCERHSYSKNVYELVKEEGNWKIVYMERCKGVYEVK